MAPRGPWFSEGSGKGMGNRHRAALGDAEKPGNEGTGQAVGDLGGQRNKLGFLRKVELRQVT